MSINKSGVAIWPGIVSGIFLVLISLGQPGVAASSSAGQRSGELVNDTALLGVDDVDGHWLLRFGGPKPALLAPSFTISYCGGELAPTIANIKLMVGKSCRSWSLSTEHKMKVYHRLEFQCK